MLYLTFKYTLFAVIATLANICTQYLVLRYYNHPLADLYMAMGCGTIAGLIIKYVLDKKFIFYYSTRAKSEDIHKFILYSFMGIFTTIIFWATEIFFNHLIHYEWSKYLGAVIGLTIGYVTKYNLDKKFVFVSKADKSYS
jgi:putative flippase GtrA